MAYVTEANIAAKLGRALTTEETTYFTGVVSPAVTAYIDLMTETSFGADAESEVYVSGTGTATLIIPTMHAITSVAHVTDDDVEEAVPVDDYRTTPRGSVNKFALRHITGEWEEGTENYKVSGKLGYAEVPADITAVATELALNSITANVSNLKSEKTGDYTATFNPGQVPLSADSTAILNRYIRLSRSM